MCDKETLISSTFRKAREKMYDHTMLTLVWNFEGATKK